VSRNWRFRVKRTAENMPPRKKAVNDRMVNISRKLSDIYRYLTKLEDKKYRSVKNMGFIFPFGHASLVTEGRKQAGARCGWRMQ
jgi:hypothetical protein